MSIKRIYNLDVSRLPSTDLTYNTTLIKNKNPNTLPSIVDLRPKCPPIYDQGALGSCTANALCAAFDYDDSNVFVPSRLFVYYNERRLEKTIPDDAGARLSDGVKTLQKFGVCSETLWPYNIKNFTKCPSTNCYINATKHKAITVSHIPQNIDAMKSSLANGFPFVVGIRIYNSFESHDVTKTGIVPLPDTKNETCLGGHAILCVGYDDSSEKWIMRNSWGTGWGMKGYFTIPYEYLTTPSLSSDLWNITRVSTVSTLSLTNILPNPIHKYFFTKKDNDIKDILIEVLQKQIHDLGEKVNQLLLAEEV